MSSFAKTVEPHLSKLPPQPLDRWQRRFSVETIGNSKQAPCPGRAFEKTEWDRVEKKAHDPKEAKLRALWVF